MFVETDLPNGGTIIEWTSKPSAPTHKTKGLSRTEYIDLFTPSEQALYFRFMDNIYSDLSFMPTGDVALTDVAIEVGTTLTYMELMIIGKSSFSFASSEDGFYMSSEKVIEGLTAMSLLGMLDDDSRLSTILQGKPL